ncbi:hypothetical protein [uncultured Dubosiella sp.]|uniref:hypothetical protein n=1 Tax=uncultured Dubosiella sp. TaxID=1937011 RepID=UPI002594FD1C|nr:hypothetical protein [uncultured Dubosiella sp.]
MEYSAFAFDHALGGPFGRPPFHPASTLPDSLWARNDFDLRFIGLLGSQYRTMKEMSNGFIFFSSVFITPVFSYEHFFRILF